MYEELIKSLRNRRVCVQTGGDLEQDYPLMREAADVIEELLAWHNADVRELGRKKSLIANMRPVVTGKWERKEGAGQYYEVRCSVCGSRPPQDYSGWVVESNYCPNCGADMRPEPPKEET